MLGPWAPKIIFGALGPPLGPWGASRPMGPGPGPQGRWASRTRGLKADGAHGGAHGGASPFFIVFGRFCNFRILRKFAIKPIF